MARRCLLRGACWRLVVVVLARGCGVDAVVAVVLAGCGVDAVVVGLVGSLLGCIADDRGSEEEDDGRADW